MAEFSDYVWLTSEDAAIFRCHAAADSRPELQQLRSLRKGLSADRARLVIEQVVLRRRATEKFGALAGHMFFTRMHLEQATDLWIARYKASRFASIAAETVADFCCGIGGDLIALAERASATGWDVSPVASLLAEVNLRVVAPNAATSSKVEVGDVSLTAPDASKPWHIDPDRRAGGKRSTTLEQHSPGPDLIERWRRRSPDAAVKLAPAAVVPGEWSADGELEWISFNRECRQLVVWFGRLATNPGQRRATVVGRQAGEQHFVSATLAGAPSMICPAAAEPGAFLYDADPAILASDLLGELAARRELETLGAGAAYLTGDRRIADPLLAGFAVQDCLPPRPATISKYLAARGVGRVEIKKRGVAVAPDAFRKKLHLRGDGEMTIILTRIGRKEVAIMAERLAESTSGLIEVAETS